MATITTERMHQLWNMFSQTTSHICSEKKIICKAIAKEGYPGTIDVPNM
jgi:hypothetical protein